MSEQSKPEKESLLDLYRNSGRIHTMTGTKPDEAIQELIKRDPEKQKAFLEGAAEGQRIKEETSNLDKKNKTD